MNCGKKRDISFFRYNNCGELTWFILSFFFSGDQAAPLRRPQDQVLPSAQHEGPLRAVDKDLLHRHQAGGVPLAHAHIGPARGLPLRPRQGIAKVVVVDIGFFFRK